MKSTLIKVYFFAALFFFLTLSISYADEITYGHDERGRQTETRDGGGWGTTVITYDLETGMEIYRKWLSPAGALWAETFTNLETGEETRISYQDVVTGKLGRWEDKYVNENILDRVRRIKEARIEKNTNHSQFNDQWDFLPDFVPGVSVWETESKPKPSSTPDAPAAQLAKKKTFGWFGKNNDPDAAPKNSDSDSPVQDSSTPAPDLTPAPAAVQEPEPLTPDPIHEDSVNPENSEPVTDYFSGSFNEPAPEEIDFSKYGDQTGFDPQTQTTFVLNSANNTTTRFEIRQDAHFGNWEWNTKAVTTRDGKVVHEDFYAHNGKLVQSVDIDPASGVRISITYNRDGTATTKQTGADGKPVKQDPNTLIEGSATDPKTGQTTSGKRFKDGRTEIEVRDKSGNLIESKVLNSGKSSAFSNFDQISNGPMAYVTRENTVPTAILEGATRDMSLGLEGSNPTESNDQKKSCDL